MGQAVFRGNQSDVTDLKQTATELNLDREDLDLHRLRMEKHDSIQRAKQLSKSQDKDWKAEILVLAKILEKELVMQGQEWMMDNISQEITRLYRKNEIKIWPWVYKYLPEKYRDKSYDTSWSRTVEESSDTTRSGVCDLPDHFSASFTVTNAFGSSATPAMVSYGSASFSQTLSSFSKNLKDIPSSELAEVYNLSKRLSQQSKKRAELEHVPLVVEPDDNSSQLDQINDAKSNEREHVTTDKPKPHGSLMYEEVGEIAKTFAELQKRVFEFPPEILQKDEEITNGLKTLRYLLGSGLDLKYGKSWLDWFKTEAYRDIYGKHAAAVMSFSLTNLCANCSDERTKEWVRMEPQYPYQYASYSCLRCGYQLDAVCPACNLQMKETEKQVIGWECPECNNTQPLRRDLTREQVGDKSSIVVDAAIQVLEHIPGLMAFFAWYSQWIEPRVAGRRSRLSDDLSERA